MSGVGDRTLWLVSPVLLSLSNPLPKGNHHPVPPATRDREAQAASSFPSASRTLHVSDRLHDAVIGPCNLYAAACFDLTSLHTNGLAILDRGGLQRPNFYERQKADRQGDGIVRALSG